MPGNRILVSFGHKGQDSAGSEDVGVVPSKILTAVGKSLTRLAALRAAMITEGEGTRS